MPTVRALSLMSLHKHSTLYSVVESSQKFASRVSGHVTSAATVVPWVTYVLSSSGGHVHNTFPAFHTKSASTHTVTVHAPRNVNVALAAKISLAAERWFPGSKKTTLCTPLVLQVERKENRATNGEKRRGRKRRTHSDYR